MFNALPLQSTRRRFHQILGNIYQISIIILLIGCFRNNVLKLVFGYGICGVTEHRVKSLDFIFQGRRNWNPEDQNRHKETIIHVYGVTCWIRYFTVNEWKSFCFGNNSVFHFLLFNKVNFVPTFHNVGYFLINPLFLSTTDLSFRINFHKILLSHF